MTSAEKPTVFEQIDRLIAKQQTKRRNLANIPIYKTRGFLEFDIDNVEESLVKLKAEIEQEQRAMLEQFVEVLIDYGLSIIECERTFNSKQEFEQVIRGIVESHTREALEQLKAEIESKIRLGRSGYVQGFLDLENAGLRQAIEIIDKKLAEGIKKPGAQGQS